MGCSLVVNTLLSHPLTDVSIRDNNGHVALDLAQRNLESEEKIVSQKIIALEACVENSVHFIETKHAFVPKKYI